MAAKETRAPPPAHPRAYIRGVHRAFLKLAVPNILSNVSVPLLSSVDTALMGQLSPAHLGAIGIGGMLFNFLYWNFGFLRMGTTGLTAQAYGAHDAEAQASTFLTAGALALLIAAVLMAAQVPLYSLTRGLVTLTPLQEGLVAEYFFTRMWAAPATLSLYVLMGWFFGQQNAWLPLVVVTVANAVNIALSYVLVVRLGYGMAGVAWGTVVAQYVALAVALVAALRLYGGVLRGMRLSWLTELGRYRRLLRVNADIFVRTLSLSFAFAFFYVRSAAASALVLATTTVLLQFLNWMSYAIDGFAYAAEALVGRFVGAGDEARTRRAIRLAFGYGAALAVAFAAGYAGFGESLIAVFTGDAEVVAASVGLLGYLVALPLVGTACYIWDGVFVGLTATRAMRDTMVLALAGYLASYYALAQTLQPAPRLWVALLVFLGLRGLLQTAYFRRRGLSLR